MAKTRCDYRNIHYNRNMSNTSNKNLIDELASSQAGVFTSKQAEAFGIPRYALSYAAKAGRIERICHGAYGRDAREPLIFVAKLSADPVLVRMAAAHGSEQYMKHNKGLPFTERGLGLLEEIKSLEDQRWA